MSVQISERPGHELTEDGLREAIIRCIDLALARAGLAGAEVDLTIVDDAEIRALNQEYRHVDRPTDVLSFPLFEPGELGSLSAGESDEGMPVLLGDVVISLPRARAQAEEYGHSLSRELCFLAMHGTLHLLGHDHDTPEEEARMREETEAILSALGLGRDEGRQA